MGMSSQPGNLARPPIWLAAVFAVVALALLAAGYRFYRTQERYQRDEARQSLVAVSVSKVDQIALWRKNRLSDAAVWSDDPSLAGPVLRYLSAPTPAGRAALRSDLLAWKNHRDYADAAVADARGAVVFSLSGETGPLPPDEAAAVVEAIGLRRPVLTDLFREPGGSPRIGAVAPMFAAFRGAPNLAGAVILRCAAAYSLYPLIASWPTGSRTAETLLVRRDGDAMLFLNDLRHRSHTALELRVPMTHRGVPSVMAGAGVTGFTQGVDYRGVRVLADIRAVPGTAWFAVTKIDVEEAMAVWRASSVQLGCLLAGLMAALAALSFAVWQTRAKTQYKLLMESGAARLAALARLAAVVECSHDAIAATTNDGVVNAWNHAAEDLYGYSAAEMIGQPIARLAPAGANLEEDVSLERIRAGERGESYDAIRLTKDGRRIDVSLSVSPLKDPSGRVVGTSRISRDISDRKRIQRELDRLRWMLAPPSPDDPIPQPPQSSVCSLARSKVASEILDAAGETLLAEIAATFHALMGTFFAVHEANGELAYGVRAAVWRHFLEDSPTQPCASTGVCEPRACGKWLGRESPGKDACAQAVERGQPVDLESTCGLRVYAVPVHAGGQVVGAIGLGYHRR